MYSCIVQTRVDKREEEYRLAYMLTVNTVGKVT